MTGRFSDEHLEAVLRRIGADLDTGEVLDPGDEHDRARTATITPLATAPGRHPTRWWLAAAAALLVVAVAAVTVLSPVGTTVADWFGIGHVDVTVVLPDDTRPPPDQIFTDAVLPLDEAVTWEQAGLAPETFDGSSLGRPDVYGAPPEGGVVFGWSDSGSSLWVRRATDESFDVTKKVVRDVADVETVPGLADGALLIDGAHVLETPSRRVAADRVLWWVSGDNEYRLESTLARDEMLEVAQLVD